MEKSTVVNVKLTGLEAQIAADAIAAARRAAVYEPDGAFARRAFDSVTRKLGDAVRAVDSQRRVAGGGR